MEKLEFLPAADNEEHLNRHSDANSLTIGSKAISSISKQNISQMLEQFDQAYQSLIEKEGNPGRRVFALKTDTMVGTDAIVSADEVAPNKIFTIIREPGTRGEAQIRVALINETDMPKTNVVHAIYGPYGPTGKGGIYTMIFGDPGEPFPRELDNNADEGTVALNKKAKEYWNGKDNKSGHIFLVTPQELKEAITQMDEHGISTQTASLRLKMFEKNNSSPLQSHTPTKISTEAQNLGNLTLMKSHHTKSLERSE